MTIAIVGTDTGVGKTVITAGLVAYLRDEGYDARAIKPVQTGFPADDDAGYVRRVCGNESAATRLRTFEEPLAPAVAARRAESRLEFDSLVDDVHKALKTTGIGIIEGAGGVRVPLSNDPPREIIDLVATLETPALIVARSGLGTLNHTALTVQALRARDVPIAGIALNRYQGHSVAERTNPDELERMCSCQVQPLPELSSEDPEAVCRLGSRVAELCTQTRSLALSR
ncbi:dethiobiotin synthase [Natronococcus occultus]|uniref:ATP-dependent dethiobiotin synthetase BioD n=1 Tax=Natronococcus occultus SP4 TaxID=694430 RepID=L0K3K5_9EURY|nr:dethiobiotin synthase [Natronococcus occultus]AGB39857.1 dethiobiotin synthase [Natronococcus occultus SP4]